VLQLDSVNAKELFYESWNKPLAGNGPQRFKVGFAMWELKSTATPG
jgi:hypothetical protein